MPDVRKEQVRRRSFLKGLGVSGLMVADTCIEAARQGTPERLSGASRLGWRDGLALDGAWQFQIDPESLGLRDGWYLPGKSLEGQIEVPGCDDQ